MKILAIEVGQFGDYYNSRYKQCEEYGADLFLLSGLSENDHWHANKFFIANSLNIDDLISLAIEKHQIHHFDGVVTFAENSVIATAMIAENLGLPTISTNASIKSRNKIYMREAHAANHAPHPAFKLVNSMEDAIEAAQLIGYPVILKPTLGSASQFVYKISSDEELTNAFDTASSGIHTMSQFTNEAIIKNLGPNALMIESYLDGKEYLVEAYIWDGQTVIGSVVDRVTLEGNSFEDDVHHAPTSLTPEQLAELAQAVHKGAVAQGLDRSIMHAEIRYHNDKPYIVEIAARAGGGGLDFMARISSGYCPIRAMLDISIGRKPMYEQYQRSGTDTFALCLISAAGVVENIEVPDEVRNDPAVFMLKLIVKKGSKIKRPPYGNDIVGFIGVAGNSYSETEEKAISYSKKIIVRLIK